MNNRRTSTGGQLNRNKDTRRVFSRDFIGDLASHKPANKGTHTSTRSNIKIRNNMIH